MKYYLHISEQRSLNALLARPGNNPDGVSTNIWATSVTGYVATVWQEYPDGYTAPYMSKSFDGYKAAHNWASKQLKEVKGYGL